MSLLQPSIQVGIVEDGSVKRHLPSLPLSLSTPFLSVFLPEPVPGAQEKCPSIIPKSTRMASLLMWKAAKSICTHDSRRQACSSMIFVSGTSLDIYHLQVLLTSNTVCTIDAEASTTSRLWCCCYMFLISHSTIGVLLRGS